MSAEVRRRFGALAVLLATLLPACATSTAPSLWRAEASGGGSLYLLGSVHMGRARIDDFGAAVNEAFAASDELVVEIDVSRVDPGQTRVLARRHGYLEAPQTLKDVLEPDTWQQLESYLQRRGLPLQQVEHWRPWFLAFNIVQLELEAAGYDPELGVDRLFIDRATGRMPVVALETLDSQLATLASMPPDVQELMLVDALSRAQDFGPETEQLIDTWRRGDEQELEELVFRPLEEAPEMGVFYQRVFFDRNETMGARLAELVVDGRSRFVVLGAGHMIGARGIPAILERRGLSVDRVEP